MVGILTPTVGTIEVCGGRPGRGLGSAGQGRLRRPGHPDVRRTHASPTTCASERTSTRDGTTPRPAAGSSRLGLDPRQKAGRLSGGQRAQLALTLGLAKRPELLILDEPVASLDPLARREFLQVLMEAVAEDEISVLLSSHVVSDLERVCDHVVVLVDSQVRVAGDVEDLLADTPPARPGRCASPPALPADQHVVWAQSHGSSVDLRRTHGRRRSSIRPGGPRHWVWRTSSWRTWKARRPRSVRPGLEVLR